MSLVDDLNRADKMKDVPWKNMDQSSVGAIAEKASWAVSKLWPAGSLSRITGSVSDFRIVSGTWYFTLEDDSQPENARASIRVFMYPSDCAGTGFIPSNGDLVAIQGQPSFLLRKCSLELRAVRMGRIGLSEIEAGLRKLKSRLDKEGVFDVKSKPEIPAHIAAVGIITSGSGAARGDIESELRAAMPWVRVILYPASVQGSGAADSLAKAIDKAVRDNNADVLILTRGGGAKEDLRAFNNEMLVRKVASSPVPVISAVGHNRDQVLTDLAATRYASTPTQAVSILRRASSETRANMKDRVENIVLAILVLLVIALAAVMVWLLMRQQ